METLSSFLVQQPLNILGVAALFFLAATLLRPIRRPLIMPAVAWLAYAGWEWLVFTQSPGANIRIDLLFIWPVVALVSLCPLFKALFNKWKSHD